MEGLGLARATSSLESGAKTDRMRYDNEGV